MVVVVVMGGVGNCRVVEAERRGECELANEVPLFGF